MKISRLQPHQWDEAAVLIHAALSDYYVRNLNDPKFGTDPAPFRVFPEIYESLDPGCCLTAEEADSGRLLGVLFFHPRPTHTGIGIVATLPQSGGAGVAKALVAEALRTARTPCRLVSSALNLASFSLYTKAGFVPHMTFQDLVLAVPADGLPRPEQPYSGTIRPAQLADVPELSALEFRLNGLQREHDYAHFLANPNQGWQLMLAEQAGRITGFLGAIIHPSLAMLGPGCAEDSEAMAGLIHAQLDTHFRGLTALWLVPVDQPMLVRQAYGWKARNTELHLASTTKLGQAFQGVTLPSFLPESG